MLDMKNGSFMMVFNLKNMNKTIYQNDLKFNCTMSECLCVSAEKTHFFVQSTSPHYYCKQYLILYYAHS